MINSKLLFESISTDSMYNQKRIIIDSSIKVYYGKTIDNKLRLSFLSTVVPPIISPTRMIIVYQVNEGVDLYWTCFDLVDLKASAIFYHICDDLLLIISSKEDESIALLKLKNRFDLWKKVLNKPINPELSAEAIKGLFGELFFLDKYLIENYSSEQAIKSWTGPEGYPKDFSINNTWFEIKTTSINSKQIKINSLGQLDSDITGNLVVIKVETMSEEFSNGFSSLSELTFDLLSKIDNLELRDLLLEKLSTKGYSPYNNIDLCRFRFVEMTFYIVNDTFPRIKQENIKFEEIEDVTYILRLPSLERFKKC